MIKSLLKILYAGKIKGIEKSFEADFQKLLEMRKRIEENKKKANETMHDPKIQETLKLIGIDVTTWPHYIKDERDDFIKKEELMDQISNESLQSIACLFLVASRVDNNFASEESAEISKRLSGWVPLGNERRTKEALKTASQLIKKMGTDDCMEKSISIITQHFDDDLRARVVKDLIFIVFSDIELKDSELKLVQYVIEKLGLGGKINTEEFMQQILQESSDEVNDVLKEAGLSKKDIEDLEIDQDVSSVDNTVMPEEDWSIIHDFVTL